MRKILLIIFEVTFLAYWQIGSISAQSFIVEKVNGDVQVLLGASEVWSKVKVGQTLKGSDLISTGEKSFIQLNNNGNRFILQSNSALGINNIKKISLNELLLALAMEEIRNVPNNKGNNSRRNTAVYGEKITSTNTSNLFDRSKTAINILGFKKLNGAKQLAQNGYKESAVLLAKETYRKYPETRTKIDDRIYFVDLMIDLQLYNEAASELNELKSMKLNENESKEIEIRLQKISEKEIGK